MKIASYITGFIDGEGCFSISFNYRAKMKTNIEVRPSFSVSQNRKSLKVLEEVQSFFQCGGIRFSKNDQTYKYEVRSIIDLRKKIIPHFKKHSLLTSKKYDFEKFVLICDLIAANQHRNKEKLIQIIELAYTMNGSGKRKYKQEELLRFFTR